MDRKRTSSMQTLHLTSLRFTVPILALGSDLRFYYRLADGTAAETFSLITSANVEAEIQLMLLNIMGFGGLTALHLGNSSYEFEIYPDTDDVKSVSLLNVPCLNWVGGGPSPTSGTNNLYGHRCFMMIPIIDSNPECGVITQWGFHPNPYFDGAPL